VTCALPTKTPISDTFPTVLVHLSDIHVSTNSEKYFKLFGDRQGDLELFSKYLLNKIAPTALIITGDLTDSKDYYGAGIQQEIEWQGYRQILQDFTDFGSVQLNNILDHRGNHDGFNRVALRGSDIDYFATYSASGIRGDAAKRVWTHLVISSSLEIFSGRKNGGTSSRSTLVTPDEWQAAIDKQEKKNVARLCPSTILLGLDFSEEPAFKNPLNFLGHAAADVPDEIRREISKIKKKIEQYCTHNSSSLPIISYGHYPLSTIHQHSKRKFKDLYFHAMGSMHSMQGAVQALVDVGTTSYWSGHLHTEFGERLHRAHLFSTLGVTPSGIGLQKMMFELETGAWKDDRRFRIAAVDGGAMSFTDLYLHTASSPNRSHRRKDGPQRTQQDWVDHFEKKGWGVTVADSEALVVENVALMTWPVDARYSPQPVVREDSYKEGTVRVLVFSFFSNDDDEDTRAPNTESIEVEIDAYLPDGTTLLSASLELQQSNVQQQQQQQEEEEKKSFRWLARTKEKQSEESRMSSQSPKLYSAAPAVSLPCGASETYGDCVPPADFVDVQVTIKSRRSSTKEFSQKWPVTLSCAPLPGTPKQQRCWLAPTRTTPAPMGTSWLEWFVLLVNFPVFVHRFFLLAWTGYVVFFLLLPRKICAKRELSNITASLYIENNLPSTFVSRFLHHIMWPFKSLVLFASVTSAWQTILLFSLYILFCPLYFTYLHDDAASTIPAAIFSFGILGKFASSSEGGSEDATWQYLATPDTLPVAIANLGCGVIPITLWIACVVGMHVIEATQGMKKGRKSKENGNKLISLPQLLSILLILLINYMLIYRYLVLFLGPLTIILSPGVAWMVPLAVALAAGVSRSQRVKARELAEKIK